MAAKRKRRGATARWRDARGRWRDLHGHFTEPPHTSKSRWPRRRKKAPPAPKPWRPATKKRALPVRARKTIPLPAIVPGKVVGKRRDGTPIVTPTIAKLAKKLNRKPATVRKWLRDGRAPRWAVVNIHRLLRGGRQVKEKWRHGRRAKWTRAERKALYEAMRDFVVARQTLPTIDAIVAAHAIWRAVKDRIRARLTRKAWARLVTTLGRKLGLPEHGSFSIESFIIT